MKSVDVVIPTYKPGKKLLYSLKRLNEQTYPVNRIILVNTEKQYFDEFADIGRLLEKYDNIDVYHISKEEFDHGRTRDFGISKSDSEYVVCMTDDAVPEDNMLIERLMAAHEETLIGASFARQTAGHKADPIETYTRQFNYSEESYVKSKADLPELGIKTYFCSNVCACYNKSVYEVLGGFIKQTIFNEDMIFAYKLITNGYKIAYVADARVRHIHHYNFIEQMKRNFDLGVSQADHKEIFDDVPSTGEGVRLVKSTLKHLLKTGKWYYVPKLIWHSGFKYLGYQLGKHYKVLPKWLVLNITMNKNYWSKIHNCDTN